MAENRIKRAELIEVIKIKTIIGDGTKENPVREVTQYWEKGGEKIFEKDNYEDNNFSASKTASSAST